MSRVHDAMRRLENKTTPENGSRGGLTDLVGALIDELADEMADDPHVETVRADLLAASGSYQTGDKKDLALRFYLAIRSLLREHALLQERLKQAESVRMNQATEPGNTESAAAATA